MNEEAGFVAALLTDPDDRTALLVYADWLQERADPRAEYLRLVAADTPPAGQRISRLRASLKSAWVHIIETRYFRAGTRVWVIEGSFIGREGIVSAMTTDRQTATVVLNAWGRSFDVDLPLNWLELVSAGA